MTRASVAKTLLVLLAMHGAAVRARAADPDSLTPTTTAITTMKQLNEWVTYYYLHPRPDLTVSALDFMSKQGLLQDHTVSSPMAALYAQLVSANPSKVDEWVSAVRKRSDDQRNTLALAIWIANPKNAEQLLRRLPKSKSDQFTKIVAKLAADRNRPDLLRDEISGPSFLDALWASYFVTADRRYVERVFDALPMIDSKTPMRKVVGNSARWSLASNARQHPTVLQICEEDRDKASGDKRARLEEVIKITHEPSPK